MTLFFYIFREYMKYVIGTIVLTIFLFVLFDFIHKSGKYFPEYKPATEYIVQFYLFQVPFQIVKALPIASLLASVVAMILLARTNEITAMRAAGMGAIRLGMPLAAGGMFLSLMSLFLGEYVVPQYSKKMHFVQDVLIEGDSDTEILEGARWVRDGETLINFGDYDPISQIMSRVKFMEIRDNFRPRQVTQAATGRYLPESSKWLLSDLKIIEFERNGTVSSVSYKDQETVEMPLEPNKLKRERRKRAEMSIQELREQVRIGERSGASTVEDKVDYHDKMAYPFAAFVVSLIGLKFGYQSERTTETAVGVVLALAIGIAYWFIHSVTTSIGKVGDINPIVAAWSANVVVLGIIVFDAWRARQSS